jgi:hypothetical protein
MRILEERIQKHAADSKLKLGSVTRYELDYLGSILNGDIDFPPSSLHRGHSVKVTTYFSLMWGYV